MTPNEPPAALLPCPLCGSSVHVKSSDGLSSILCESPSTCIGSGLGFMFIDEQRDTAIEAWNRRASTATVASESRGSVPDGFVLVPRKPTPEMLGAAAEHVIRVLDDCDDEPQYIALGVAAAAYKDMLAASPTPPAVASGEPTAEQDSLIRELRGVVFNYRQRVYLSYAHGAEADSAIAKADAYLARSAAAEKPR